MLKPHRNLNSLEAALEKAWDELDEDHLHATAEAFPERLRACAEVNGLALNKKKWVLFSFFWGINR